MRNSTTLTIVPTVKNNLVSADRKTLLLMAAQSGDLDSMFAPSLIAEVASYADPSAGSILARWTALPQKREIILGDSIRSFEIAYAALARLRCPLTDHSAEAVSPADQALLACGQMFYWLNRDDLSLAERKHNCAEPLAILSRHETGVAAAVMSEFFRSDVIFSEAARRLPGSEPVVTSLGSVFPEEIAAIYRASLANPTIQSGYFDFFQLQNLIEKALSTLGHFGNKDDIPLLRVWSAHPDFGYAAVDAIRSIEEKA